METFLEQMKEILEVDTINGTDLLVEFEAWDSLTQLSIIALADEYYNKTINAEQIKLASTVDGLYNLIKA